MAIKKKKKKKKQKQFTDLASAIDTPPSENEPSELAAPAIDPSDIDTSNLDSTEDTPPLASKDEPSDLASDIHTSDLNSAEDTLPLTPQDEPSDLISAIDRYSAYVDLLRNDLTENLDSEPLELENITPEWKKALEWKEDTTLEEWKINKEQSVNENNEEFFTNLAKHIKTTSQLVFPGEEDSIILSHITNYSDTQNIAYLQAALDEMNDKLNDKLTHNFQATADDSHTSTLTPSDDPALTLSSEPLPPPPPPIWHPSDPSVDTSTLTPPIGVPPVPPPTPPSAAPLPKTVAPSIAKSKSELHAEAVKIGQTLETMKNAQDRRKNYLRFGETNLYKNLNKLYGLFDLSQKSADLISSQNIDKTIAIMERLSREIIWEIQNNKPQNLSEANFQKISDEAIENLKARKDFMPSWQVTYTEVNTTGPEDQKAQLEKSYRKAAASSSPANTDPSLAALTGIGPETSVPTDPVTANRYREGTMGNGAQFIERLDEQNNFRSELIKLPDTISTRENIMASLYSLPLKSGQMDEKFLRNLFQAVDQAGKHDGTGITQENIVNFLRTQPSFAHPKNDGETIFKAYSKAYSNTMYQTDKVTGKTFPNNELFRMAIQQVEGRMLMDTQSPICITKSFSSAYVEAIMLYCHSQNYPVENYTQYKNVDNLITKNRINDCTAFLERSTNLGYDMKMKHHRHNLKNELNEINPPRVKK